MLYIEDNIYFTQTKGLFEGHKNQRNVKYAILKLRTSVHQSYFYESKMQTSTWEKIFAVLYLRKFLIQNIKEFLQIKKKKENR